MHEDTMRATLEELEKWHGYNVAELEGDESQWNDYEFHKRAQGALLLAIEILQKDRA